MPEPSKLWKPEIERLAPSIGGKSLVDGRVGPVVINTFKIHSKKYGKTKQIFIPADRSMSTAEIDDLLAQAKETCEIEWEEQRQMKVGQHVPSPEERREVGAVIRNIMANAVKRKESTNGKIHYKGSQI